MTNEWGSNDVLFLSPANSSHTDWKAKISESFISHQVPVPGKSRAPKRKASFTDSRHVVNAGLIGLGKTLIEIGLGKSFEELMNATSKSHPMDKAELAPLYLVDQVKGKISKSYGKVIQRCLDLPPVIHGQDLDDEKFSLEVLKNIVVPLKQELDSRSSKWPDNDESGLHDLDAMTIDA